MYQRIRTFILLGLLLVLAFIPQSVIEIAPRGAAAQSGAAAIVVDGVTATLPKTKTTTEIGLTAVLTTTLYEDFEDAWPTSGWDISDHSSIDGGEYLWGKRDCHPHTGDFGGWSVGGGAQGEALNCANNYPADANTWAVYGGINLHEASSASLTFHLHGSNYASYGCATDYLFVGSSTDTQNFVGRKYCGDWTTGGAGNGYYQQTLDLNQHLGQVIYIGFIFVSSDNDPATGFTIDDISLNSSFGMAPNFTTVWSSAETAQTSSVAWGDYDNDGDLDLAVGSKDVPVRLYRNDEGTLTSEAIWSADTTDWNTAIAWGDYDNDGDLDLTVGNGCSAMTGLCYANHLYQNDRGQLSSAAVWSSTERDDTTSIAWGDYDGDGDLDLLVGNRDIGGQPNRLYRNDNGILTNSAVWSSAESEPTTSVAWGDYDGDGDLDLVVGNYGGANRIYRNVAGVLTSAGLSTEHDYTLSVAWSDYDNDGDLDLAVGNGDSMMTAGSIRLYHNNNGSLANSALWTAADEYCVNDLAWGDYDGDGDLDLVAGTTNQLIKGEFNRLYRNDAGMLVPSAVWIASERDTTTSVAWGDYDNDGDIDLAVSNDLAPVRLYRNEGSLLSPGATWSSAEEDNTYAVAWGDYDRDGDLDLATGNDGDSTKLYRNDQGSLTTTATWTSTEVAETHSIAWGDYDGDDDLDLIVGNAWAANRLYRNDAGILTPASIWSSGDAVVSYQVAWGDYDGDADLDLAVGNAHSEGIFDRLYRNDAGTLATTPVWQSSEPDFARSAAWGDYDNDSDLDLVTGNLRQPLRLYRNDVGNLTTKAVWNSDSTDNTYCVAWGDYDGDGDLDLAVGNDEQPVRLYQNNRGELTTDAVWSSSEVGHTSSLAWGDYDGDMDLDLIVGNALNQSNWLYRNDGGTLAPNAIWSSIETKCTNSVAWGDYDNDGDLDLAVGNSFDVNYLHRNTRDHYTDPASIPILAIERPIATADADFYSTPQVWTAPILPITYTLYHRADVPAREIRGYYSLNGGGQWFPAVATSDTITTNLASGAYPSSTLTNTHLYKWDIQNSGLMGQYDNVVFRLVAIPAITTTDGIPGPYQFGKYAATTFPFRVRGNQVRVISGTQPVSNALVYRLPAEHTSGGALYADAKGMPFRTNGEGYLQGHGEINLGDQLLALVPITYTDNYTLYYTNGTPNTTTLAAHTVTAQGVQTLTVSVDHPLYLFNLDIALEWDAHNSTVYLERLEYDLQRAAEHFYDFTDGQATLGEVYVFHDAENWNTAHMRIYANNRLRPNAVLGGMVGDKITDTLVPTITYDAGQIRMPAEWNRYGDPGSTIDEDWPRTLAHEMGHYYLFLDDHYLGYDDDGQVTSIDTCTNTAMTDPYRYSEYRDQGNWLPPCEDTMANHLTGRSDWATIAAFYPQLTSPDVRGYNDGPRIMPYNFTEIKVWAPLTPTDTIPDPTFYFLDEDAQRYQPTAGTRGFLIKDETWLIDVGEPVIDHILARGAVPSDRLCVFDTTANRGSCETLQVGDDQLILYRFPDWQPEIIISPAATNTIDVTVHTSASLSLQGRIFSTHGPATEVFDFTENTAGAYETTMTTTYTDVLLLEGFVHIWVDETAPRREMITDYSIGAAPGAVRSHGGAVRSHGGAVRSHGGAVRSHGGAVRSHGVPILSGDGQMTIYTPDPTIPNGEFLTIQSMTKIPSLPAQRIQIGQAYRIAATAGLSDSLAASSVSFQYLGEAVPAGMEEDITIYHWDENEGCWYALPTTLDLADNFASARLRGSGLYALLTAFRVPLYAPGWNMFSYPLRQSQAVTRALSSIDNYYTTIYGYDATAATWTAWSVYDITVPGYVNDLEELEFGHGYWISVTQPITAYFGIAAMKDSLAIAELPPQIPATYYGQVLDGTGFTAAPNMTVTAWISNTLCGIDKTLEVADEIVYAVNVLAETEELPGCGAAEREVTFQIGTHVMSPTISWNDHKVRNVPLTNIVAKPCTPTLLLPANGAVMDNGRTDGQDTIIWDFDWEDCMGASQYHLYVSNTISAHISITRTDLVDSEFHFAKSGTYFAQLDGWKWQVRAKVGEAWGTWSATRQFSLEPANTDSPFTPTPIPTATFTDTATPLIPTATPSETSVPPATVTVTPSPTVTPTSTSSPTATRIATASPTPTLTPMSFHVYLPLVLKEN